jgi:tetratricopeptide (TPR) repeat protein
MSNINYNNPTIVNTNTIHLDEVILDMRKQMQNYINTGLYSNALFYADKIFYLSLNKDLSIISEFLYDLAQCLYFHKEYYRCVNLIQKYNMSYYSLKYLNLLGMALLACEDYEAVITYLDKDNITIESNVGGDNSQFESIRYLIIAKAYEMQENKQPAIRYYRRALSCDAGNMEAFEILNGHNLISSSEMMRIIEELSFTEANKWLYDYYLSKASDNIYVSDKSDVIVDTTGRNVLDMLYNSNDQDLLKIEAEKLFQNRNYTSAYNILKK